MEENGKKDINFFYKDGYKHYYDPNGPNGDNESKKKRALLLLIPLFLAIAGAAFMLMNNAANSSTSSPTPNRAIPPRSTAAVLSTRATTELEETEEYSVEETASETEDTSETTEDAENPAATRNPNTTDAPGNTQRDNDNIVPPATRPAASATDAKEVYNVFHYLVDGTREELVHQEKYTAGIGLNLWGFPSQNGAFKPNLPLQRDGYTFIGWYEDKFCEEDNADIWHYPDNDECEHTSFKLISATESGDKNFYGKWVKNIVPVATETSLPNPNNPPATTAPRPVSTTAPPVTAVTTSTTATDAVYIVNYNLNGGHGEIDGNLAFDLFTPQQKTHNIPLTLHPGKPVKPGSSFAGWSPSPNGTGIIYPEGGTYTDNASVTLYAVWAPEEYNITYRHNYGTPEIITYDKYYYDTVNKPLLTPAREGYSFKGWYDNPEFNGEPFTQISNEEYGDKEYWAKWEDDTPPVGVIYVSTNSFNQFIHNITFGLLFKDSVTVTIVGADTGSGVKTIEYLFDEHNFPVFDDINDEAPDWDSMNWVTVNNTTNNPNVFSVSENVSAHWAGVVYARITDNAGNQTIINSDGFEVYYEVNDSQLVVYREYITNVPLVSMMEELMNDWAFSTNYETGFEYFDGTDSSHYNLAFNIEYYLKKQDAPTPPYDLHYWEDLPFEQFVKSNDLFYANLSPIIYQQRAQYFAERVANAIQEGLNTELNKLGKNGDVKITGEYILTGENAGKVKFTVNDENSGFAVSECTGNMDGQFGHEFLHLSCSPVTNSAIITNINRQTARTSDR